MRPLKLKMSAFGTYEKPLELDFEEGLSGKNFFLIHGATGSGKTTILDAVCYALYEESSGGTDGGGRDKSNFRSEYAAEDQEMSVELTFAIGKTIYRIKRTPNVKSKGKKTAELYVDGNLKISGAKETNQYIKNLLGFSASQFRQTVILPQGKFREFLTANSQKREELLSVMFNANFYEQVEKALLEREKKSQAEFENLEASQKNFVVEEGEVQKVSASVEELKVSVEKLRLENETAQANLTAGKILVRDFEQLESSQKKLFAAESSLSKILEELTPAKVEFDKRKGEEKLRQDLSAKITELKKIFGLLSELQKKSAELDAAKKAETEESAKVLHETNLLEKYQQRVNFRKTEIERLQGAEGKFATAENDLKRAQDKEDRLKEIDKQKKILVNKQQELTAAEKKLQDAQKILEQMRRKRREGSAALLAKNLQDGKPCPVCGSVSHPKLAISAEDIPSDDQIKTLERQLQTCTQSRDKAVKELSAVEQKIAVLKSELEKLSEVLPLKKAQEIFAAAKADLNTLIEDRKKLQVGEVETQKKSEELVKLKKNFDSIVLNAEKLRVTVEEKKNQIPSEYLEQSEKLETDLQEKVSLLKSLETALKVAEEKFHTLDKQKSNQEVTIKYESANLKEVSAKLEGKIKPDIELLSIEAKGKAKDYDQTLSKKAEQEAALKNLLDRKNKLDTLAVEVEAAKKNRDLWKRLSDVANGKLSKEKISFRRAFLQSIFSDVIEESNAKFDKVTEGRYKFMAAERANKRFQSGGLDIKIFDAYTGKTRPATTLSGGESFLAALSLALGLAQVVKNIAGGIKLDAIFIDEGFGSLDSEALDMVISTLEELNFGGRLVGIISHVDELKQRIPVRLEVQKSQFGSTAKFVQAL